MGSAGNKCLFAARRNTQAHALFDLSGGKFTERSKPMWKKVLLASAVTGLLAGAAVPIQGDDETDDTDDSQKERS